MSEWKPLEPAAAADDVLIDFTDVTDADQCLRVHPINRVTSLARVWSPCGAGGSRFACVQFICCPHGGQAGDSLDQVITNDADRQQVLVGSE